MSYPDKKRVAIWIPTPIYEALPYLYIMGGVLFISGTLYIDLAAPGAALYLACGLISIVYGAVIFAKRLSYRQNSASATPQSLPEPDTLKFAGL